MRLPCEPAAGWLVVDCRGRLLWASLFIVPHSVLWFTHIKGVAQRELALSLAQRLRTGRGEGLATAGRTGRGEGLATAVKVPEQLQQVLGA